MLKYSYSPLLSVPINCPLDRLIVHLRMLLMPRFIVSVFSFSWVANENFPTYFVICIACFGLKLVPPGCLEIIYIKTVFEFENRQPSEVVGDIFSYIKLDDFFSRHWLCVERIGEPVWAPNVLSLFELYICL